MSIGNNNNNDDIQDFIDGKDTKPFGLHIITTPDTKILGEKVRDKIQNLLDNGNSKEQVTSEHIKSYQQFANGETGVDLDKSIRGKHVYVFSDPHGDSEKNKRSLNDKLTHDKLVLDAAKENGARTVNLIQPCMPYARQDKTTYKKRQPASFDTVGRELSHFTGSDGYIMNIDLHNPASKSSLQGTKFINLHTGWFINKCIHSINQDDIVLSGADQGGDKKISAISKDNSLENIIAIKTRNYAKKNSVDTIDIYGDIEGKNILVHDDILDTGGTLCKLLREMLKDKWILKVDNIKANLEKTPTKDEIKKLKGLGIEVQLKEKPKSINIAITHGEFNKDSKGKEAFEKLQEVIDESNGIIKKIYITDSINKENLPKYVEVISLGNIIANNIFSIFKGLSIDRDNDKNYSQTIPPLFKKAS